MSTTPITHVPHPTHAPHLSGKETVKKLHELQAAAAEAQLPLPLPEDLTRIVKVRDFLRLTQLAAEDGHLQQVRSGGAGGWGWVGWRCGKECRCWVGRSG